MAKRGRPRKPIAQLVWLGDGEGMLETEWNEVKFLAGVPTNVSDPVMVATARENPYYEVVEEWSM